MPPNTPMPRWLPAGLTLVRMLPGLTMLVVALALIDVEHTNGYIRWIENVFGIQAQPTGVFLAVMALGVFIWPLWGRRLSRPQPSRQRPRASTGQWRPPPMTLRLTRTIPLPQKTEAFAVTDQPAQPIGYHFDPYQNSEAETLDIVRRSKARTHTVMHSAGLASKVYATAASVIDVEPIIILRADYPDSDWRHSRYANMRQYVEGARIVLDSVPDGRKLYWQWLNEPIATTRAELMQCLGKTIDFMDECERAGVRGSLLGAADAAMFQWELLKAGDFDAFLRRASAWTNAGHGVVNHHSYMYLSLPMGGGGKNPRDLLEPALVQPARWPTADQMQRFSPGTTFQSQVAGDEAEGATEVAEAWADEELERALARQVALYLTSERVKAVYAFDYPKLVEQFTEAHALAPEAWLAAHPQAQAAEANWLTMRYMWPLLRCEELGVPHYRVIVGEGFWDDMPNLRVEGIAPAVEQKFAGGLKLRSFVNYVGVWRQLFPDWSPAEHAMKELAWFVGVQPACVLGGTIFAINKNWPDYDPRNFPDWWPAWDAFVARETAPPAPPAPPPSVAYPALPDADDDGWADATFTPAGPVNIRSQPVIKDTAPHNRVGELQASDAVRVHAGVTYADSGGVWQPVESGVVRGWARVPPARYQPVFGPARTLHPVPFVDQYGADAASPNACGPASGAMAVNFRRLVRGEAVDVTALAFSNAMGRLPGSASYLSDTSPSVGKTLRDTYGIEADYRAPAKGNAPTVADMRAHIQSGGLVLPLFERGKVPGTQAYYTYTRAHIAPLIGEGEGFFVMSDPLATDDRGKQLKVSDADLAAAMAASTWADAAGKVSTNSGPQALFVAAPVPEPVDPPPDDEDPPVEPPRLSLVEDLRQLRAVERQIETVRVEQRALEQQALALDVQRQALWLRIETKVDL